MKLYRLTAILLLCLSSACTTIAMRATGGQGFVNDPSARSAGAVVEDEVIETRVVVNLKAQEEAFRRSNFHVYSHNGVVLIVGQVTSQRLKDRATEIASQASNSIKRIHNELEILNNTDFISRGNDTLIATRLKTRMIGDKAVPAGQVRVITENSGVYLMGLVTRAEGDAAARLASNMANVTRVVKVFEYID